MIGPMTLEIWDGDWGLPSVDISSLQIMVYCKFGGVTVVNKVAKSPFRRKVPAFRHGRLRIHTLDDVMEYLRTENVDVDNFLTKKNYSDIQAFTHLLKEKLYPALQFVWWVDNKNYVSLTRPWYAKKLPFPLNFYYPGQYEARARDLISSLYGSLDENYAVVQNKVYADAEKCLTILSVKLGDSKYFFGTQPSSFDAIVFSYLAPLLRVPFHNQALQNHLKACPNLVSFVNNILDKYYSSLMYDYGRRKMEVQRVEAEGHLKKNLKRQVLAFFIAMAAMFGYMSVAPAFLRRNIKFDRFFSEAEEEVD